ncbi:MAG: restriction endonuclease subunit S [Planctomycetaceae bacterium]
MKNGWDWSTIGECCELTSGGTPSKQNASFWNGDVPFVSARDLKSDQIETAFLHISREAVEQSATKLAPVGSLLMLVRGMGLANGIQIGEVTSPVAFNQDIRAILPPKALVVPRFLLLALKSSFMQGEGERVLSSAAHGTLKIDTDALRRIAFPVPPLAEQRRIVGILDEAFEGLATAKANAEQNLQNARALFESHLQAVFTQRGHGWVEKSVGELVAEGVLVKPFDGNHGEIHPRKADYTDSGVPFIMACDLQDGSVDTENCTFISRKLADSLRVGFAKDGDVVISHKGTIGRSAIVRTADDYIMLTPQVTGYRVKNASKLFNRFVRFYFMSPLFQREMIAGAADGSTRAYIGITKQLSLRFRFPLLADQKRIAAKLDVLDRETQRLESLYQRKLAALDELKKSLLHRAFSGQL